MHIDTTLLREKFIIKEEPGKNPNDIKEELWACSNRILLNLQKKELAKETFVIRTDSMHLCARMAGYILADYENRGPLTPRIRNFKWDIMWDSVLSNYERRYNKSRWVSIYHKGKVIFTSGKHHAFFDIIEKFESAQRASYTQSLVNAEKAFKNAGKKVSIDYASNVALSINMDHNGGRCGAILRSPNKTMTFNYHIKPRQEKEKVAISQGLTSTSDFMEGVNLSYFTGVTKARIECDIIDEHSDEAKQMRNAITRIKEIDIKINSMENRYLIRYRPERPIFELIIAHTQNHTKQELIKNMEALEE